MAKTGTVDQARNFFSKLSPTQRIIIGGTVGAVLVAIILMVVYSQPKKEMGLLFSSLEPQDASKIVLKLKEKNIPYELSENGTSISVEKKQVYEQRLALAGDGLPEQSTVGYEIFDRTNLGMSEFVQKLNYRRALEGELARTIGALDEIKKVRVHLVIPEKALFDKDQKQPTASVQLHLKSGKNSGRINIEGIQNLVASSLEGMNTNSVVVVDQKGKILSAKQLDEKSASGMSNRQYEQQKNVDTYLSGKVQSMLDGVLGQGNAEVRVNSELDFTQIEKTITDFDPARQVARSEQTSTDNSLATDSLSSKYDSLYNHTVKNGKNGGNSTINYEIPSTVEKIIQEVGNIKRLSVAVLINGGTKINEQNGKKVIQYIPRNEEEMQKLTQVVKNAVGYDPSRNDQVSVLTVPFDSSVLEEDLKETNEFKWWQNPDMIKLIALLVAMLIAIILMYRLLQSKHLKEKLRIALRLPDESGRILGEGKEHEIELEDMVFDDDEMLMLPSEAPEQLLLAGEKTPTSSESYNEDEFFGMSNFAEKPRLSLDSIVRSELNEDALLKMELRSKVKDYLDDSPQEAVRLFRILLSHDYEEKQSGKD